MAFTPKDNTGSIWANDKKENDTHPDRTGSIMVNGVEFWLSGWLRKTKDGKPFMSLSVRPKTEAPGPKPELDDTIPF
jgi:hypothetical protein